VRIFSSRFRRVRVPRPRFPDAASNIRRGGDPGACVSRPKRPGEDPHPPPRGPILSAQRIPRPRTLRPLASRQREGCRRRPTTSLPSGRASVGAHRHRLSGRQPPHRLAGRRSQSYRGGRLGGLDAPSWPTQRVPGSTPYPKSTMPHGNAARSHSHSARKAHQDPPTLPPRPATAEQRKQLLSLEEVVDLHAALALDLDFVRRIELEPRVQPPVAW